MITFVPAFGDPMATMYALLDDEHVRSPLSAEYEQKPQVPSWTGGQSRATEGGRGEDVHEAP
jgi:hypothetical protein